MVPHSCAIGPIKPRPYSLLLPALTTEFECEIDHTPMGTDESQRVL